MIRPLIVGRGSAGQALRQALAMYPDEVAPAVWLERGAPLPEPADPERELLLIANPHALHTPRLLEAAERGYRYAVCEKPAAVDLAQLASLDKLPLQVWVCHGYRMLWGPRELRRAWRAGRFGRVLSIEGRYWHSSATHEAVESSWKDDPELSGRHDVLLDLATHWTDLVVFLAGRLPAATTVRRWHVNASAPHRDTHLHLAIDLGEVASLGSVSKTVHGAGNLLELWVLGEDATARWRFSDPDVIVWGTHRVRSTQTRVAAEPPYRPPPFHGLGWMEGYGRLVAEVIATMAGGGSAVAPTLAEHLAVLRCLLEAVALDEAPALPGDGSRQ